VSAGAVAGAVCTPAALGASAQLAGTPLLVTPAPGGRDAMPQTELSFLGAPAAQLSALVVRGSASGLHDGRLAPYSQGDGASFLPRTPFRIGESVSVSGSWSDGALAHPFAYSFTIGDPDPIARLPESGKPAGKPGTVWHFRSAPGLTPSVLTVTKTSAAATRDGDIFLATYPGPGAMGPTIFDPSGQLVWFKPLARNTFAADLRVQRYDGRPVLTWWQGTISNHGFGLGEGEIYSSAYHRLATVRAGDGLAEDLHELQLTPRGSALITAWKPLYCDLAGAGGRALAAVYDAVFQEIDIRTGLVRYEWDSLEHVPLSDSYMPVGGASVAWPYDWFHLNSIALESDGSLLISARSTWTVYDIDAATGQIVWRAGGREPTFTMGPGTPTAWQHDARPLGADSFSVFDNGGPPSAERHSRGAVVRIDRGTATASLVTTVVIPTPIFAETQGDLQQLPDRNWWIGWGNINESSEVAANGRQLFEAHTPAGSETYRSLRFAWSGRPSTAPSIAVRAGPRGALRVYVSWNGATAVARWRLEAGPSPGALRPLRSVARRGFETLLSAPASTGFVAVAALGAGGRVLARSPTARGSLSRPRATVFAVHGPTLSRRAFLRRGALTALGASALAGCGSGTSHTSSTSSSTASTTGTASTTSTTSTTTSTAAGPPTAPQWSALRRSLSGQLVLPDQASYADAKLVYDLRFENAAPAAIGYAASTTDVQRLIDFARNHALAPIPRCGGHSYAGYSTGSGLIVDVSALNGVRVAGSVATVGAGTRLVDLYSALAGAGVLVPGGSCPSVGIAGLALGGGVGVLGRKYGLTADAIESLTVVGADGRVLRADAASEPDLYWASRGGGGRNLGIVTSFDFTASPIPPLALFTLEFPWGAAGELFGAWAEWIARAPDELWSNCLLLSAGRSGLIARATGVYVGEVAPLTTLVSQLSGAVGATPTTNYIRADTYLQAMLVEAGCAEITLAQCHLPAPGSAGTLSRAAFAAKSAYFSTAPAASGVAAIVAAVESFQRELPGLGGGLAFDGYGGAINAVAADATAFVHRNALCQLQMSGSWGPGASSTTTTAVAAWLSETANALARYTNGEAYQNYIDPTLSDWAQAYYGANLARLRSVKHAYDPDRVFDFAQAI
jgi:FAD/FMN-containing dehydrogenase